MSSASPQWPTFLGIGVPKAGTTWLYKLLETHPRVWVPPAKREVHFFDREFHQGRKWYGQFFPGRPESTSYEAVGEVTPHYLYCEPERIEALASTFPTVKNLLLLLRDPVDRLYSHYWFRRRVDNFDYSFRRFVEENPNAISWGKYAKHIQKWLEHFDRSQVLVMTTEQDLGRPRETREQIAHFLEIDPELFPEGAGRTKQNSRHLPYFRNAYALASWIHRTLQQANILWPTKVADQLGIKRWFGKQEVEENIDPLLREELSALYRKDVKQLEQIMGRKFTEWKTSPSSGSPVNGGVE